MPEKDGTSK